MKRWFVRERRNREEGGKNGKNPNIGPVRVRVRVRVRIRVGVIHSLWWYRPRDLAASLQ